MNKPRFALIAGCAFFAAVATSANAQVTTESISVKVRPYELASIEGRAVVIARMKGAAARLCWLGDSLVDGFKRHHCELQVMEQMVRQTENPELLAQWKSNDSIRTASRN